MHEMSIATSILEAVAAEAARYPGSRPCKVGVCIGELAAVDPESLQFCFEALIHGTEMEHLQLAIEFKPRRHRCVACDREFSVRDYDFRCPDCGEFKSECISGDELQLAYVEVEGDEPTPLRA
jgi:hydrogenase nickel incorporation protein HypA/HybF